MFDDLIFALKNFRRNKVRSILSLLGIIIGVASVIVITSLSQSATKSIKDSYNSASLDIVRVSAGFMSRRRNAAITFDETFRQDLFNSVKDIKQIQYTNNMSATLTKDDLTVNANATAVEYGYFDMYGYKIEKGTDFNVSDNVTGQQKIIIGSKIADALFENQEPIGNVITLVSNNVTFSFEVCGVLAPAVASNDANDNSVFVPRGFYAKKIMPSPAASAVLVQCVSQEKSVQVADNIKSFITELTGNQYAANVSSMQAMLEQYEEVSGTVSLMLSGIAAISLLVGGIGIMNIMIVTVTERKKEIGIRKALGASPNVIRLQFLMESVIITVLGGILGIIFGIGISAIVAAVMEQSFAIQVGACFVAFGFSVGIGIIFGFSPASQAAKLNPVEALTTE